MKAYFYVGCLLFSIISLCLGKMEASIQYAPIVQLSKGAVRGRIQEVANGKVYFYEGIRYGHAKRFEKPTSVRPWTDVYNATEWREQCSQVVILPTTLNGTKGQTSTMAEDCLYLNIWRPMSGSSRRAGGRPVMVYIHGGSYMSGSIFSDIADGRHLSYEGDVVLVTIAYRLGPFGLLYGGEHVPANLALHDQLLALQWVQENIHHFTGDPTLVTLFGESSGSMNVGHLILSPLSNGLFRRAILQSGSPLSYYGILSQEESLSKTRDFARALNCSDSHLKRTIDCLKQKSPEEINQTVLKFPVPKERPFLPVYGDELLPNRPVEALKGGHLSRHLDLLYGVNNNEGSHFALLLAPELLNDQYNFTVQQVKGKLIDIFKLYAVSYAAQVADYYIGTLKNPSQDELKAAFASAFGDYHLTCGTILFGEQLARLFNSTATFYSYRLMQKTSIDIPFLPIPSTSWTGVFHGEDVMYLFADSMLKKPIDHQLGAEMRHAWAEFARTGAPGSMQTTRWTRAVRRTGNEEASTRFMALKANEYTMVDGAYRDTCEAFWKAKMLQ